VQEIADISKAQALEGTHNWQNAAAAYAAIAALGIAPQKIGPALISFPGLAHRMETVGTVGPVRYVNDSKATNADAARQALEAYDNIYWIAGGVPKEGGIEGLIDLFPNVTRAYLIGEASEKFSKTLKEHKVQMKILKILKYGAMRFAKNQMRLLLYSSVKKIEEPQHDCLCYETR